MLPSARATAPRIPNALKSGRNDGSLNVPLICNGDRSTRMLLSFGRGFSSRSRVSSRRLTVPSPMRMVSVVSTASAWLVIRPSCTPKSAKAQRSGICLSPVTRNFSDSVISSPASSITRLPTWPRPIASPTLPLLLPSMAAIELPRPLRSTSPPMPPLACSASFASGKSWPSCTPRTLALNAVRICAWRASMRIVLRISPPATPKFSGSSRSTPSSSSRCASMSSSGNEGALMRWAFQRTSASIARSLPRL